ncbi:MAG: MgtC/SapB family protein [Vicinamibacterales bacterium]
MANPGDLMDVISIPANSWMLAARLAMAAGLGAAVGLNREMTLKPAGLRTHALVALGAALLTLIGLLLAQPPQGDISAASRIVQGIVAGIGFIGGGVILHGGDGQAVHGLTTASSIWIVAAVGVAVGAGLWRAALVTVLLALVVLVVGGPIDRAVRRLTGHPVDRD